MLYLNIFLQVPITLVSICLIDIACMSIQGKGTLPDPKFILDYLRSFTKPVNTRRSFKGYDKTILARIISDKIKELKPFLQDNDKDEILKITDSESDDTTAENDVQFSKRLRDDNELEEKVNQFKILRDKISKKLTHESISDTTAQFILQSVDSLIDNIRKSQCDLTQSRKFDIEQPIGVMFAWKKEWEKIKKGFAKSLYNYKQAYTKTQSNDTDYQKFIDHVIKLINDLSNDIKDLPDQYKVMCKVLNGMENKAKSTALRDKDDAENKMDACGNFKVCSYELQDYLLNYYEKNNDTAVGVVRNYAEMFTVDVQISNDVEKEFIIPAFKRISEITEQSVLNIFIAEVKKLKLNENKNKDDNLKILKKFTNTTLLQVKDALLTTLSKELGTINRILPAIKEDIRLTAEVDLHNLQRDLLEKLCNTFQFCNGDYNDRRKNSPLRGNVNKTYVAMHLEADDITNISIVSPTITTLTATKAFIVTRTTLAH